MKKYGVIVIGGGHAGCETANASARSGVKTLLVTMKLDSIGQMSCNPAVGGIGKSHLAREVDALGGLMCKIADNSALQKRKLNSRKGPAVQATRIQTCRDTYKSNMQKEMQTTQNLDIQQATVSRLLITDNHVRGIVTDLHEKIFCEAVILTAGTFLGGMIHVGNKSFQAGRSGDKSSVELESFFRDYCFDIGRLKTGTPPRINKKSINYEDLLRQDGDREKPCLSYLYDHYGLKHISINEIPCHITHTNEETHKIIKTSRDLSPMYNGKIDSLGPRYCPSIEDKVMRFADKKSHQIFLEPETLSDFEVYPNGLSTSLPVEIQENFLRTIKGLENCIITQPGYAIEYSFFEPTCLNSFLETKKIKSLFFAGQINGTTGYEEAAAQGVLAGINASCVVRNINMWSPKRNESYLGVMVDDLITHGVTEPYRMFTSRAEHRLRLREDNADERLTEIGFNLGVVNEERFNLYKKKISKIQKESERLEKIKIMPDSADSINLENKFNIKLKETQTMKSLLKKSDIGYQDLCELETFGLTANSDIGHLVAINERYSGYLKRQDKEIAKMNNDDNIKIPSSLVYSDIKALSNEAIEKLKKISPKDLGQASRIEGVTPAMISLLRIYIKKYSIN